MITIETTLEDFQAGGKYRPANGTGYEVLFVHVARKWTIVIYTIEFRIQS